MPPKTPLTRVAYSPGELAQLFGKSQTWGYRQIYAGKVKTITNHGRIMIPAAEVERILSEAGIYNGEKKRAAKRQERQDNKASLWKQALAGRKPTRGDGEKRQRSAALARLGATKAKDKKASARRLKRH